MMLISRLPSNFPAGVFSGGFDRVLEDLWRSCASSSSVPSSPPASPALNVWDSGDSLHIEAELPGVLQDDLVLELEGREFTLAGEFKASPGTNLQYHRRERATGTFKRVLQLPFDVDAERIEAKLVAGVLNVELPKAETARVRTIQVNSSDA